MPIDPLLAAADRNEVLLEVDHVAHHLSLSPEQVRRLLRDRKIAAIRLGKRWRVKRIDLLAFVEAQRVPTNGHGADA